MKLFKRVHIAAYAVPLILLTTFLVWQICTLSDLPQKFGMHFGEDGNFDIFSENKVMAFYPFFAGYGLFVIFTVLSLLARKIKKVGGKHTEQETEGIRREVILMCDLLKLCWAVFWSFWSFHVIHQSQWHFIINRKITVLLTFAVPAFAVIITDEVRKHKLKKQVEK